MDRKIVYPGQIPLDSDLLYAEQFAVVSAGRMAGGVFGETNTAASGFACTPGSGLAVVVAPGQVVAQGVVDATAFGTLDAVSSVLPRQYILRDPQTLTIASADATYIVYATVATSDIQQQVLPFYNASNPSQTFAGQGNSGAALPTVRSDAVTLAIGTSVPSGGIPLWSVDVPSGATSITAAMISKASGAPIYRNLVDIAPRVVAPYDAALSAALGGYPLAVLVSDTSGALWLSTADSNTTTPGASGASWVQMVTASAALTLAQEASGAWTTYTASTSLTVPSWATRFEFEIIAAGGGGAGCQASSTSESYSGGGGGSGSFARGMFSVAADDTIGITIGAGGAGGVGSGQDATAGGATSLSHNGTTIVSAGGGGEAKWTAITTCAGGAYGIASSSGTFLDIFLVDGGDGDDGQSGTQRGAGGGASSALGGRGRGGSEGGQAAHGYGAGGGGSYDSSFSGTVYSGGAGFQGVARVRFLP